MRHSRTLYRRVGLTGMRVGALLALLCAALGRGPGAPSAAAAAGDSTASASFDGDANHLGSGSSATFSIARAPLLVRADDQTKVLGAPNPPLTASYSGFVSGETATVLSGSPALSTTATASSGAGSYPIVAAPGTLAAANYAFTFSDGTLTVRYASGGTCLGAPGHAVLQPVNADGTSIFKQKAIVPVKFRVCDASGASVGTPGVVADFRLVQVTGGTASRAVNEAADATTPDATFRWDPDGQQWILNLSTRDLAVGATYAYRITLNDGSTIDFQFGLR